MKFEVRQHLPRPAATAWRELFSQPYENALAEHHPDSSRGEVEEQVDGTRRSRRTPMESSKALPGAVARALGVDRLRFLLQEDMDDEACMMTWSVAPTGLSDKLSSKIDIRGTYALQDTPDGSGCERIVKGEIRVAIPLLGGKIEQAITDELRAGYDRGIEFARTWLLERT